MKSIKWAAGMFSTAVAISLCSCGSKNSDRFSDETVPGVYRAEVKDDDGNLVGHYELRLTHNKSHTAVFEGYGPYSGGIGDWRLEGTNRICLRTTDTSATEPDDFVFQLASKDHLNLIKMSEGRMKHVKNGEDKVLLKCDFLKIENW